MSAKEWKPYLVFIVNEDSFRVTWSPQSSEANPFVGQDPASWSASSGDMASFRAALKNAKTVGKCRGAVWSVRYGDARSDGRTYEVSIDRVAPYLIVRLYRMPHDLSITEAEMRVLRLLVRDYEDSEIAETIGCSRSTVRKHVENLRHKFRVKTRGRLTLEAYRSGLVNPPARKHYTR